MSYEGKRYADENSKIIKCRLAINSYEVTGSKKRKFEAMSSKGTMKEATPNIVLKEPYASRHKSTTFEYQPKWKEGLAINTEVALNVKLKTTTLNIKLKKTNLNTKQKENALNAELKKMAMKAKHKKTTLNIKLKKMALNAKLKQWF